MVLISLLLVLLKLEVDINKEDSENTAAGILSLAQMLFPMHNPIELTNSPNMTPRTNLLHLLAEVAATPPIIPVDETCAPKPLPRSTFKNNI